MGGGGGFGGGRGGETGGGGGGGGGGGADREGYGGRKRVSNRWMGTGFCFVRTDRIQRTDFHTKVRSK